MESAKSTAGNRLTRALTFVLKLLGVALATVVVLLLFLTWACSPPSDKSLARRLGRHRSDFETLVRMSREDVDVIRIADDFTRVKDDWSWPRPESKWGISRKRWDEYRELFHNVGLSAGLQKDEVGNVFFIAHTQGLAVAGASKGLVYCFQPGEPDKAFLPCREGHQQGQYEYRPGEGYSYRKLTDNWYVFEEWN